MRNPLNKRIPKNFVGDLGKYFVIFAFLILTIGFVSGFLVAGDSLHIAYEDSFEKYHIEDGHFVTKEELTLESKDRLEQEKLTLYENFYRDLETDNDKNGEIDSTLRVYANREEVNQVCLMEGQLPKKETEIAIDRMYADNNELDTGDTIVVDGKELTVSGLVALSDYSALFSDNSDLMFDADMFGVAVMTAEGFANVSESDFCYDYAWVYDTEPKDDIEAKEMSDDFLETLVQYVVLEDYQPEYSNQAIHFTGDDIGGDRTLMTFLLYVVIVILGFVFAITINHTIEREANVIGTLRASGYTKGELRRHYLIMPMLITLIAAIIGNILGYTVFKYMVADMYYGSYSLPTYETIWNAEAFIRTTIVPMALMFVTNYLIITKRLQLSPMQFLRRDLSKQKKKRAPHLPKVSFLSRFRMRVILQNMSGYVVLFVGIFFANVLLLFGMMMSPLLDHYEEKVLDNMVAEYQYVLKAPVETSKEDAEKYSITTLESIRDDKEGEKISIYGIQKDSEYIDADLPEEGVYISDGFAEKYQYEVGDTITLKELYGDKAYDFQIKGIQEYPSSLAVFMTRTYFNETFQLDTEYYNGYFSNETLDDVAEEYVASCVEESDMTKVSRQLKISMGEMFIMVNVFAVVLSALLLYLLTKLIVEKNANAISMVKILGYSNGEIGKLYLMSTAWVVVISVAASLLLATAVMEKLFFYFMQDYGGWISCYIAPEIYWEMAVMNLAVFAVVAAIQFRKIRKIPMEEALKNVE